MQSSIGIFNLIGDIHNHEPILQSCWILDIADHDRSKVWSFYGIGTGHTPGVWTPLTPLPRTSTVDIYIYMCIYIYIHVYILFYIGMVELGRVQYHHILDLTF